MENFENNSSEGVKSQISTKSNSVKMPLDQNAIVIMFKDNLTGVRIEMTPLLWDMLKILMDKEFLFTTEKDGCKLSINVSMEKLI